ncbi:MAG: hypothetical protein GY703_08500 [Gammaproteobacteria bacterium]|nr:hypothetical protein [Gammaproteobacteria bacterium]
MGSKQTEAGTMAGYSTRIAQYRIETLGGGLRITQDQRRQAPGAALLMIGIIAFALLFSPIGPFSLNGTQLPWSVVIVTAIGGIGALAVISFMEIYTREHLFTQHNIRIIERRADKLVREVSFDYQPPLDTEILRLSRLGRNQQAFPWQLILRPEPDDRVVLQLARQKDLKQLLEILEKHLELSVKASL